MRPATRLPNLRVEATSLGGRVGLATEAKEATEVVVAVNCVLSPPSSPSRETKFVLNRAIPGSKSARCAARSLRDVDPPFCFQLESRQAPGGRKSDRNPKAQCPLQSVFNGSGHFPGLADVRRGLDGNRQFGQR